MGLGNQRPGGLGDQPVPQIRPSSNSPCAWQEALLLSLFILQGTSQPTLVRMGWYPVSTYFLFWQNWLQSLSFFLFSLLSFCVTKCDRPLVCSQPLFYFVPHDKIVERKRNCRLIWVYKCSLIIYQSCKWSMINDDWSKVLVFNLELNLSFFFFASGFLSDLGLAFVLPWPFSEQQTHYIVVT